MKCTNCGNEMSHHRYSYYNRGANQCEIEIVECANCQIEEPAHLAALREAGEKMAKRLRVNRTIAKKTAHSIDNDLIWVAEDATALEAWEAANK